MQGGKIRHLSYDYKFTGQRFIQELNFGAQYFNLYRHRLCEIKSLIDPPDLNIYTERITDIKEGQHVFLIGIIIRSHTSRSSNVEKYISKVGTMEPRVSLGNFCSSSDLIFLEDENGRIAVDSSSLESE